MQGSLLVLGSSTCCVYVVEKNFFHLLSSADISNKSALNDFYAAGKLWRVITTVTRPFGTTRHGNLILFTSKEARDR